METTDPRDQVRAARAALAPYAAQVRALKASGSPHAASTAETARKRLERLRSRLGSTLTELDALERELSVAQDWHDRYERVQRT